MIQTSHDRGPCPVCGRHVALRDDGEPYEHSRLNDSTHCRGRTMRHTWWLKLRTRVAFVRLWLSGGES